MAAYGIDTLDPAVTPRRVAVLMSNLPPSARGGGEAWSTEAELLAVLCDQLSALTYVTLRAHGAKNVPQPRPVPRPGRAPGRQPPPGAAKHTSWADAAAALAGMPGMVTDRGDLCVRRAGDPGHR
jgi:hypothetical protein